MSILHFPPMLSTTAIILNGQRDCLQQLQDSWRNYQQIIVCDGAWQDVKNNFPITKNIIVLGDGDSINQAPKHFIYIRQQDNTDFEKAIQWAIQNHPLTTNIDIYWGNGGELDHTLGNLAIGAKYAEQFTLHFYTENQYYRYIKNNLQIFGAKEMTISFFPFAKALIQQTQGLQYPMKDYETKINTQQSLRNFITSNQVSVQAKGNYFVFLTKNGNS
ncbi:MAG: thiamine diphosphokinase [Moraxellaceae bacterium]|nr:thiamine diphosphokinase [Moraxellaceae bacterium]